jgi:prophage tail gpP-like protein
MPEDISNIPRITVNKPSPAASAQSSPSSGPEIAELIVNGVSFQDWKTVNVEHRWKEGWPTFLFTSAERSPLPTLWTDLQFKPRDRCRIILGGQQAMDGIILHRQTAYDAKTHVVQLAGAGIQWAAATSSIKTKDNNFDNMTLKQIADKVMGAYGILVKQIGTVDQTPFYPLQSHPGDNTFEFLDRLARTRNAHMGSDANGNFLLIGDHSMPLLQQQLIEGQNIEKMQCVFSIEQISTVYSINAQTVGGDDQNMAKSSEMSAAANGSLKGAMKLIETVAEQPVKTLAEVQMRANYEAIQREATEVTAHVTVQGWLRDGKNLWMTGDEVLVYSPMAMLNLVLKIKTATFTQDTSAGTLTTLELVLPWMLGSRGYATGPTDPKPPEPAVIATPSFFDNLLSNFGLK